MAEIPTWENKAILISIIIPTHSRCDLLRISLESLNNQTFPKDRYEIIVVDNASFDNTKGVVMQMHFGKAKEIRYVYEGRLGVHYARNSGARVAKGAILAFADDDAIYDKDWLSSLYRHFDNTEVGCVGGKILAKWETSPPLWINRIPASFFSLLDLGDQTKELPSPDIYSLNMSVRKDLFFKVGGIHPGALIGEWLGDGATTTVRKILTAKYKVVYTPNAVCWHAIPRERLTLAYLKRRASNAGVASSYAVYKKNRPNTLELILRSCVFSAYSFMHKIAAILNKMAGGDALYSHECKSYYYYRRATYELRLSYSKTLKKFVLNDNWLDENKN